MLTQLKAAASVHYVARNAFTSLLRKPNVHIFRRAATSRSFSSTGSHNAQRRYVRFGGDPSKPWDISKWNTETKLFFGVLLGSTVYYVAHLEKVPETGRLRFMDVGPKLESRLAQAAREELIQEFGGKALPANHPLTQHVRRVVSRILEANNLGILKSSGKPATVREPDDVWDPDGAFGSSRTEEVNPGVGGREWELMVVNDDKMVNAMAAYGDIVVFTGILPVAKDEQGLAAILGHEIAHVVARHSSERVSGAKVALAAVSVLAVIGLDFGLSNILSNLLLELPNGRTQEFEADQIGLRLISKACYDPKASPAVFSRLAELEAKTGQGLDFLATHPASKRRVERLNDMLPQAYQIQAESPECARMQDSLSAFQNTFSGASSDEPQPVVVWKYV